MKRHSDALYAQHGACNPSALARALVTACDEARDAGVMPRNDAACRLIAHQIAFLLNLAELDEGIRAYEAATQECARNVDERTREILGIRLTVPQ